MPKICKQKSRGHVFTVQNYTDANLDKLKAGAESAVYMVFGKEVAPETGTPHLQGYVYYKNSRVSSSVCKKIGASWSECAKGSPQQNTEYCIKDGDFIKYGVEPKKGERNDLKAFVETVVESEVKLDEEVLIMDHTNVLARYPRFVDRVQRYYHPPKALEKLNNHWFHGQPGTGKSYTARQQGTYYVKAPNKWFDGYADEDVVIVEDIEPQHARELSHMLKIIGDIEPFTAEVKGSTMFIRPKQIIVTSNYTIEEMGWDDITTRALQRRYAERNFAEVFEV